MRQRLPGTFRTGSLISTGPPGQVNMLDTSFISQMAAWTPGSTLIDPVQFIGPLPNQNWEILGLAFQASIAIWSAGGVSTLYGHGGKLGKIIGALLIDTPPSPTGLLSGLQPWTNTMLPVPQDQQLTVDLWNPDTDPFPPLFLQNASFSLPMPPPINMLEISGIIIPPIPVQLVPGVLVSAGMWMLPSLICQANSALSNFELVMGWATYSLYYDDGF